MGRLSAEKIAQIKAEYAKDPVYSHVAKICGTTAATVKKYVTGEAPTATKSKSKSKSKDSDIITYDDVKSSIEGLHLVAAEPSIVSIETMRGWGLMSNEERDKMYKKEIP